MTTGFVCIGSRLDVINLKNDAATECQATECPGNRVPSDRVPSD